jgi:beta-lactamase regulating signal transducer with metallopeptidase domain
MNWDLFVALLVRSSVVLAAGEAVRQLCRRSGPAVRFRIRMFAAGSLAILPLLSTLLPEINIPLWHSAGGRAMVTVTQTLFVTGRRGTSFPVNWALAVWLIGVAIALAPAVVGMVSIFRIRRRSVPLREEPWTGLLGELCAKAGLGTKPEVLRASGLRVPVTSGLVRPRILLPADCSDWSETRRRAVLLHELAHIRRHDLPAQVCVHVIAAFWWFQPLVWAVRHGIRHESELACDAETVPLGIRPSQYAAELLGIAKGLRRRDAIDKC